ncbi:hypothetical protein [Sphingomonas sp. SUN039]|uniref:hypothetical protein n=1 Tax=Sphingomonas sp. SUN039 TaxID=2937787 RepID=UPI002164C59A|nr:hypothetical protein [Sphingomonas sp. SUN039]UVO53751.1 hypothetical protein M0209_06300 [Sphingomonas sp. SUN039]
MKGLAPFAWTALGAGLCAAAVFALAPERSSLDLDDKSTSVPPATVQPLTLDEKAKARASVRVVTLAATQASAEVTGFARGLDVGTLAVIDAEAKAADATAAASRAEAGRLATLASQDQSASRRSVEAARAQSQADDARAQLARRRVGLEFGPGLARLGSGGISALVSEIANGRAALVRIDIANIVLKPGSSVRIGDGANSAGVRVLGAAATADAKLQSAGVLAIVRGNAADGLLAGRILPAFADTGSSRTGVTVPRDAIVRYQGGLWVFVEKPDKSFARVELVDARAVDDGWFVPGGLTPGTRIAVSGAGSLMAIEKGGEPADEDE